MWLADAFMHNFKALKTICENILLRLINKLIMLIVFNNKPYK